MLEETCVNATWLLKQDVRSTLLLRVRGAYLLIIEQTCSEVFELLLASQSSSITSQHLLSYCTNEIETRIQPHDTRKSGAITSTERSKRHSQPDGYIPS